MRVYDGWGDWVISWLEYRSSRSPHLTTSNCRVLNYLTFNIPLVVWLTMDQFRNILKEIDEAAVVDGVNMFQVFSRVVLPLATPGVVVGTILSFIFSWNEMLFALILTRSKARTAPVAATSFMSGYDLP